MFSSMELTTEHFKQMQEALNKANIPKEGRMVRWYDSEKEMIREASIALVGKDYVLLN